ncbi:MAG: M16 family metallopeptidase [Pyrinomonadaceae bacterium]
MRKVSNVWLFGLALVLSAGLSGAPQFDVRAQEATKGQAETAAPSKIQPPVLPDTAKVKEVADKAAALVTEFDVNGLKVLVKRRAGSLTVATGLFLRGGARNVTTENAGIEALMWDAATEASQAFPRELLRREQSRTGTAISFDVSYDYSLLGMISTRPNFDRSWQMFADIALHPTFAPEDVKREQNKLAIARNSSVDVPDAYLQVLQSRVAYAGHPYSNDPEGTAETISRLTVEDVRAYHKRMLETSRLLLVIVGDLDAATLRQRIADTFGKLPRGTYKAEPLPQLSFATGSVDVTQKGLPTNYVQGIFAAPSLTSEDIFPMRVASAVLSDRVLVEVRFRRNLSYAPSAFLREQGANIGGIYVTAVDANQAVDVMLKEIARLQRERADSGEIESEISGYLTRYYMGQETNLAQAAELGRYELIGGGWRNSLDFLERLRAVTPADVQRVAQKYMHNLRFVVIGDPKAIDRNVFTSHTGD